MADEAKPYLVRTDGGTFVRGHDSLINAEQDAAQANFEAEKLGIKTRYVAEIR